MNSRERTETDKRLESAEDYRQILTMDQQADYIRDAYKELDEDEQGILFNIIYAARERHRPRFTVIQGGKAAGR